MKDKGSSKKITLPVKIIYTISKLIIKKYSGIDLNKYNTFIRFFFLKRLFIHQVVHDKLLTRFPTERTLLNCSVIG